VFLGSHSVTNSISFVTASSSSVSADISPMLTDPSSYSTSYQTHT